MPHGRATPEKSVLHRKGDVVKDPLVLGFLLVAVDVAVWRSGLPRNEAARLFVRLIVFGLLSAVLFSSGLSPFGVAPWPESAPRHVDGQVLEIICWLAGARLPGLVLSSLLLPRTSARPRPFWALVGVALF